MQEREIPTNIALVVRRMNTVALDESSDAFIYTSYGVEAFIKTIAISLYAGIRSKSADEAYALGARMVRADGLGEFEAAIREATSLPMVRSVPEPIGPLVAWLTKRRTKAEDEWFKATREHIRTLFRYLPTDDHVDVPCERVIDAITALVRLRNKTKAHGALGRDFYVSVNESYREVLTKLISTCPAMSWQWVYLRRTPGGEPRGTVLNGLDARPIGNEVLRNLTFDSTGIHFAVDDYSEAYFVGDLIRCNLECSEFGIVNGFYNEQRRTSEFIDYADGATRSDDVAAFSREPVKPPPSDTAGQIELDVQSNTFGNLPPVPEGYVKRQSLERQLYDRLLDMNHAIITLHGRGGVGKTSLALRVAHDLASESAPRFEFILWFSSRDIELRTTGPSIVSPEIVSIADAAKVFGRLFGRSGSIEDFASALRNPEAISRHGMLFIFDNFESVSNPTSFQQFLDTWAHHPNKVLITSRQRAFKADFPIEVRGMEFPEAQDLLKSLSRSLGIEGLVTDEVIDQIFTYSEGHVYVMRVLMGEIAKDGRYTPPHQVIGRRGDIIESVFERSFSRLTRDGRNVFLLVANWRTPVPELGLLAILSQRGIDAEGGIDECERMSLVLTDASPGGGRYCFSPKLSHIFGKKKLTGDPDAVLLRQDIEALRSFGTFDGARRNADQDAEVRRFISWCNQEAAANPHKMEYVDGLFESTAVLWPKAWLELARFRIKFGTGAGVADAFRRAVEEVPNSTISWLERARYAEQQGDGATFVASLDGAAESAPDDPFLLGDIARRMVAYISRHKGEFATAERSAQFTSLRKRLELLVDVLTADTLAQLGWLYVFESFPEKARQYAVLGLERQFDNEPCRRLLARIEQKQRAPRYLDREGTRNNFRDNEDREALRSQLLARLQQMIARATGPVLMSKAGKDLIDEYGVRISESSWLGAGSFRQFLQTFKNLGFAIDTRHPGYIYDPLRHELPIDPSVRTVSLEISPERQTVLRAAMLRRLQEIVHKSQRPVVMAYAALELIREFGPILHESNWFGSGSFGQFLSNLGDARGFAIDTRTPGFIYDSTRHQLRSELGHREPAVHVPLERQAQLSRAITDRLEKILADSEKPILVTYVVDQLLAEFGLILRESKWLGYGTFTALLNALQKPTIALAMRNGPDVIYDPTRHTLPPEVRFDPSPELRTLLQDLHGAIKCPMIGASDCRTAIESIVNTINALGYDSTFTSKRARDLCTNRGASISRVSLQWILDGLVRGGTPIGKVELGVDMAMDAVKRYIVGSSVRAGRLLNEDEQLLISAWVEGR